MSAPRPSRVPRLLLALAGSAAAIALAAAFAPYLYPEYVHAVRGKEPEVLPAPALPVVGRWIDDYFLVEELDPATFAIGEPRYYQGNYSYLLLGSERAVLFDAGSGTRDIVPVVRALTRLPVTVAPSHLHFDHVGALNRFEHTALLDLPQLRARARGGQLRLGRYEFLGFTQDLPRPMVKVDEWWAPGRTLELGGRQLEVLWTPGHTPSSFALYDRARGQLFGGDFIYPGPLYAFYPGASRSAYLATTQRLLRLLGPDVRIFAAHMAEPPAPVRAPVLGRADLEALERTLLRVRAGREPARAPAAMARVLGYPRAYAVGEHMTLVTGYPWNNR